MRVSIIGAARNRSGIGPYIARYFHQLGANVVSLLGTTEETSQRASGRLRTYGIRAVPYIRFDEMIEIERPEAVVIASPPSTHHDYLNPCIDLGLHIFCEKPFIWEGQGDLGQVAEGVCQRAGKRSITVAMNSQWPFSIGDYECLSGPIEDRVSNRFFIRLSPLPDRKEMIVDSVPHALSLLYAVLGPGEIGGLHYEWSGDSALSIRFHYRGSAKACEAEVRLVSQKEPPRDFAFGFNGNVVTRSLDLENYDIYFHYGNKRIKVIDPLEASVRDFMRAVEQGTEPRVGYPHIVNNTVLLKKIYDQVEEA